jgi:hypothetical protein
LFPCLLIFSQFLQVKLYCCNTYIKKESTITSELIRALFLEKLYVYRS